MKLVTQLTRSLRYSIATRLIALAVVPSLILFVAIALVLSYLIRTDAATDVDDRARVTSLAIANSVQYYMTSGNTEILLRALKRYKDSDSAIAQIDIVDNENKLIASVGSTDVSLTLSTYDAPIVSDEPQIDLLDSRLGVSARPVVIGQSKLSFTQKRLGTVRVAVALEPVIAPRYKRVLYSTFLVLLLSCVVTYFAIQSSQHLRVAFAQVLSSLSLIESGKFKKAMIVDVKSGDFGRLQKSVNAIAVAMDRSRAELVSAVETRTKELLSAQADLRKRDSEKAALLARENNLMEEERRRLSHEIHDRLNVDLVALRMTIARLIPTMKSKATQFDTTATRYAVIADLEHMDTNITGAYDAARSIVRSLRIEELDTLGLEQALRSLVNKFENDYPSISFSFASEPKLLMFTGISAITIYRVVQECLTNVVKHANASHAKVTVRADDDAKSIKVRIKDDGEGFDTDQPRDHASLGLVSIRERAESVSGKVVIRSKSVGTQITLELPMPDSVRELRHL
jgi:two-component system, NarL family, sensor histidine kinase UhpB